MQIANRKIVARELNSHHIGTVVFGHMLNNGYMQDTYAEIVAIIFNHEDTTPELDVESSKGELVNINVQTLFYTFSYGPDDEVELGV